MREVLRAEEDKEQEGGGRSRRMRIRRRGLNHSQSGSEAGASRLCAMVER